jgi:ribonuclease III
MSDPADFSEESRFRIHDTALLRQALTHSSYANETGSETADNQRLEYLGDAVLGLLVAEILFTHFPDAHEGWLTSLRASLVREEALATQARAIDLGEALLLGRGEELNRGRERNRNLASAYEALVGALYIDQGLPAVRDRLQSDILAMAEQAIARGLLIDARSQLQEHAQAELGVTPRYHVIATEGPGHALWYTVEVWLGDWHAISGQGSSKQQASQAAAANALEWIAANGWPAL